MLWYGGHITSLLFPGTSTDIFHKSPGRYTTRHQLKCLHRHAADYLKSVNDHPRWCYRVSKHLHLRHRGGGRGGGRRRGGGGGAAGGGGARGGGGGGGARGGGAGE